VRAGNAPRSELYESQAYEPELVPSRPYFFYVGARSGYKNFSNLRAALLAEEEILFKIDVQGYEILMPSLRKTASSACLSTNRI
jgi:hypothetical protein